MHLVSILEEANLSHRKPFTLGSFQRYETQPSTDVDTKITLASARLAASRPGRVNFDGAMTKM